jgi:hypothetical protein
MGTFGKEATTRLGGNGTSGGDRFMTRHWRGGSGTALVGNRAVPEPPL